MGESTNDVKLEFIEDKLILSVKEDYHVIYKHQLLSGAFFKDSTDKEGFILLRKDYEVYKAEDVNLSLGEKEQLQIFINELDNEEIVIGTKENQEGIVMVYTAILASSVRLFVKENISIPIMVVIAIAALIGYIFILKSTIRYKFIYYDIKREEIIYRNAKGKKMVRFKLDDKKFKILRKHKDGSVICAYNRNNIIKLDSNKIYYPEIYWTSYNYIIKKKSK